MLDGALHNRFYVKFLQKLAPYEELDVTWRNEKIGIANFLSDIVSSQAGVHSLGCDFGFVESYLCDKRRG